MPWVVDTCLLIDIAEADPSFGTSSAKLLDARRPDGLTVCPVTFVELAPVFQGDLKAQGEFLFHTGITWPAEWTTADTEEAFRVWNLYVAARRTAQAPKRPLADILIGAFASRFSGVLTRNEADFRRHFPALQIVTS